MRDDLLERLHSADKTCGTIVTSCDECAAMGECVDPGEYTILKEAADAIEELLRIGAKMHTWIFLHTTDEQAAYDEIGLTEEQNALFGYSGQMILKAEPPKGDSYD